MASDILIVDDEADIRELVSGILEDEGHRCRLARDSDEALRAVEERRPHLVILDIWLQGSRLDGLEVLSVIKRAHPDLPVVIISGHGNIETAVTAIKRGAYDYIEKPFKADRLILVAMRALEASQLKREVKELRERSTQSSEMIGKSAAINQLQGHIDRVAPDQQPHPDPRRLRHRQGAGRARHASEIQPRGRPVRRAQRGGHGAGPRRGGAVRHRGPHRRRRARSARSRRRTAARSTSTRSPTCRWRRRARCCACWSSRSSCASAAPRRWRSMCASSPRPAATSSARWARAASARTSITASTWCRCACRAWPSGARTSPTSSTISCSQLAQASGLPPRRIGEDAIAVLQAHDWPGNVRELSNNIERLLILAGGDPDAVITADMLPEEIGSNVPLPVNGGAEHLMSLPLREAREIFEREYLLAQINRFGGNISRTAEFVGMERSALHRKLRALGVSSEQRGSAGAIVSQA